MGANFFKKSLRLITVVAVVFTLCLLPKMSGSFAKYSASLNGSATAQVAQLVYEIDNKDIVHDGSYVQIAFTKGTVGQFRFKVANHKTIGSVDTLTQVSFRIKVDITIADTHDVSVGRLLSNNALFNNPTEISTAPSSSQSGNGATTYTYEGYSDFNFGNDKSENKYFVIEFTSNTPSTWENLYVNFTVEQID